MQESFLHYIWQFQYFLKKDLFTSSGEPVQVLHTGYHNSHAGPDFLNARVKIGAMEWVGNVEIHVQSSGWINHKHSNDPAYNNVVLHVVWQHDKAIVGGDGTELPTLELHHRIDERLLLKCKQLVYSPEAIPCAALLPQVSGIVKLATLDKVLAQRFEAKTLAITKLQEYNLNDWNETGYQLLCRAFGFKVNAEPFQQLARALPYKIIRKHADKLYQIEALLFGMAGFLEQNGDDEYYSLLKREYLVLRKKYEIESLALNKAQWRFLRLRPANFPTTRLAQLATLLFQQPHLFSKMTEAQSYADLHTLFSVKQSSYWLKHYRFFKEAKDEMAGLGTASIENIIINVVVPLQVAIGKSKDEQTRVDQAIALLQQVPTERNAIIKRWQTVGMSSCSAFDSQALLELYNDFCLKRRCLECNIGVSLIKPMEP